MALVEELAVAQALLDPLVMESDRLNQRANQLRSEWLRLVDPFNAMWNREKDATIELLSEWIALDDEHAPAFVFRAVVQLQLSNEIDRALADVNRAAELNSESSSTWAAEAFLRHRKGESAKVMPLFTKALATKNVSKQFVLFLRAKYYEELGNFTRAQADYRAVLKEKPDHLAAIVGLADMLAASPDEKIRNVDEALKYATRATELAGVKCWPALLATATATAEAGKFDDAIRHAEKALSISPQSYRPKIQERLNDFRNKRPWRMVVTKKPS